MFDCAIQVVDISLVRIVKEGFQSHSPGQNFVQIPCNHLTNRVTDIPKSKISGSFNPIFSSEKIIFLYCILGKNNQTEEMSYRDGP